MSTGHHLKDLGAVLAVTEQMLRDARDEAWEKLTALETSRQGLIHAAFADPIPPDDAATVAGLIGRIQALNHELVSLSSRSRDRIASAIGTLAKGRRAQSAYGSASGR